MRGNLEYLSDIKGDCADDIDLNSISNDTEKQFLCWTKVLEDTISHLQQTIRYYKIFLSKFALMSKYNCFFTNFLVNLCVAITMDIGKLCSDENDLSLNKYNKFCRDNANVIFKQSFNSNFENNRTLISELMKKYKELIMTPRNSIYGHNDKLQLEYHSVEQIVSRVSVSDLQKFVNLSKPVLFDTWMLYNSHSLCFEYKNSNDYEKIIEILEKGYN